MYKSLKTIGILLVMIMFLSLLSACGGTNDKVSSSASASTQSDSNADTTKSEKPITLHYWGWVSDSEKLKSTLIDPAIAEFNAHNDYNAKVEYLAIPTDQYDAKLTTEVAANNVPDLFMTYEAGFLEPFVKAGKVHPLDDLLGKTLDAFSPSNLDMDSFDGKRYAVPTVLSGNLVYYNKEIFDKYQLAPPKTMDDLMNVVKTLKSNGITPFTSPNKDLWPGGLFINTLAYRYGGKQLFYDLRSGVKKFTNDTVVKAAKDYEQLVKAGAFDKDANSLGYDEAKQRFFTGKAGMWLMGSWELSSITSKQQDNGAENPVYGKVGFFNWPSVPGGVNDQNAWILMPDYNIAIGESCPNKEAAAAFIKILVSEKLQKGLVSLSNIPAINVPIDTEKVDPLFKTFVEAISKASESLTAGDRILGQQTLGDEFSKSTQEMIEGTDAETAMKNLEERVAPLRTK